VTKKTASAANRRTGKFLFSDAPSAAYFYQPFTAEGVTADNWDREKAGIKIGRQRL